MKVSVISFIILAIAWLLQDLLSTDLFLAIQILCFCIGSIIFPLTLLVLLIGTMESRIKKYCEKNKDTKWAVGRWSSPSDIFARYLFFGLSFLIPWSVWYWSPKDKLVYWVLLFAVWSVCYVFLVYHFMVRPSLRKTSFKARNRYLMSSEVTSLIGMVLGEMGIPHERYTPAEYIESGPDARLKWEMKVWHPTEALYDLHPDLSIDRAYTVVISELGGEGICYTHIRLTPYDDETATFFDGLADAIDRVLF